jgi:iron complex outermembrane receptor protein
MMNRTEEHLLRHRRHRLSRSMMELGGGDLALAIGADLHRDTTEDNKLPIVEARSPTPTISPGTAKARATSPACSPSSTRRSPRP